MLTTFTSILADHGHWDGPGPWFLIFPLLWFTLLAFVVWRFWRSGPPWRNRHGAEAVLAEQYARGHVSVDEYQERLRVLREAKQ